MLRFSHITWPLCQITKGRVKYKFSYFDSQHNVFVELKHHLCYSLVLTLVDLQQPIEIETYASDYDIVVVLTQHEHVINYHSETLSDTIQKYPTYDKEMNSIM